MNVRGSNALADLQVHGQGNLAYEPTDYELWPKGLSPDGGKQLAVYPRTVYREWQALAVSFRSGLTGPPPAAR
jgi:hypothetical protein